MDLQRRFQTLLERYGTSPAVLRLFRELVYRAYRQNRRDFPWRRTRNPYHIIVSEVMLQQTQTGRVCEKYEHFLKRFPDFASLESAPVRSVLEAWQGLGYNRRAIKLKELARTVMETGGGTLPTDVAALRELPGIGPATAAAVVAFVLGKPSVLIETNIRRVFIHCFFRDQAIVRDQDIKPLIELTLDHSDPRTWYYALMDYGAWLAKEVPNPNRRSAHYTRQGSFEGSERQLRGKVVRLLVQKGSLKARELTRILGLSPQRLKKTLTDLETEGFIRRKRNLLFIPEGLPATITSKGERR